MFIHSCFLFCPSKTSKSYGITLKLQDNEYCIGWQNSGLQTKDGKEITLLGGISHVYSFTRSDIFYLDLRMGI